VILGIGVDLVALPGLVEQLGSPGSRFLTRVLTAREARAVRSRAAARGLSPDVPAALAPHVGARWAAKEAAVKAWSAALAGSPPPIPQDQLDWREIEVVQDHWGRPLIVLHGRVAAEVRRTVVTARPPAGGGRVDGAGDLRWHVSLSHDGESAQAFVLLERIPPP